MIQAEGLQKVYGDLVAVQDLTFRAEPGEVVGLVGPNGAGKTTTLHCLSGITIPTRGQVRIAEHDLATDPVAAKSALAFVPDEPHLFEYLTVEEHLRFVARLYRVEDVEARLPGVLRELELEDRRGSLPEELSRGMKQKLAIACALIHAPRALLLDEPLTGLDPVGIRRMKATIVDHARSGAAVILSSHLLHLVEEICSRVLIMQRGRVLAFGAQESLTVVEAPFPGWELELASCTITPEVSVDFVPGGVVLDCLAPISNAITCNFFNIEGTAETAIPTLSEWGMIAAAAGLGLVGVLFAVRRKTRASR